VRLENLNLIYVSLPSRRSSLKSCRGSFFVSVLTRNTNSRSADFLHLATFGEESPLRLRSIGKSLCQLVVANY
jgi:hypothetical protein